jgi:GT2 family glycosyltransferase/glycosyltransferase involved in cell wall biosynthesis
VSINKSTERISFDREIELRMVDLINGTLLLLEGDVKNSGSCSWSPSSTFNKENEFRMGVKVFICESNEQLLEDRSILPAKLINPGERASFRFLLNCANFAHKELTLVLDILREGEYWLMDRGVTPATICLKIPSVTQGRLELASDISEVSIYRRSATTNIVKGKIKNIGSTTWTLIPSESSLSFQLGARALDSAGNVVWEGRGQVSESQLESDQDAEFSILIDPSFFDRSYNLQIGMLIEGQIWFFELGDDLYKIALDSKVILDLNSESLSEYAVSFTDVRIILSHGFILRIAGRLTNTGTKSWDYVGADASETALRVGALLQNLEGTELFMEGRGVLNFNGQFKPLDSTLFSLTMNLMELPSGKYSLTLDLVKETEYWFHQKNKISYTIPYEFEHPTFLSTVNSIKNFQRSSIELSEMRILYIAPILPLFDRQSGGNRLLEILQILANECREVQFAYEGPGILGDPQLYIDTLNNLGIKSKEGVIELLSEVTEESFDVCVIGWYDCASKYLSLVRTVFPKAQIIVDTVDIHWQREARGKALGALLIEDSELEQRTNQEVALYQEADLLWTVTEEDSVELRKKIPQAVTSVVSNVHHPILVDRSSVDLYTILFVGGFRHPPNEGAALWGFEIVETLRSLFPFDFTYLIVGDSPPDSVLSLHDGTSTIVTGYVPSLEPYYEKSCVMIAPLLYGSGIKGKICHAICAGVPVVSTSIGIEGTGLVPEKHILLADTKNEFIEQLSKIVTGKVDLNKMTQRALDKILLLTGVSSVKSQIQASLSFKKVVIGIVTFNKLDLLKECITSILQNTDYPHYQLAIVSNGCSDGTREYLLSLEHQYPGKLVLFFNLQNDFYVKPNNVLMRAFPDSDMVLVNNDMLFNHAEWLRELYLGAYSSPLVGAAGGLILDPAGLVSEAGAELHAGGYGTNISRGMSLDNPLLQIRRYVGYVSGCLLYMKREFINKFGVFDERFHPMYYEDADWQYRIHQNGIKTLYVPTCRAVHREGSSAGSDIRIGMKRFQEINRLKLLEKYKGVEFEELND